MEFKKTYQQWNEFDDIDELVKKSLSEMKTDEAKMKDAFYAP